MVVKSREVNRRIERLGGLMARQVGSHRRYVITYTDAAGSEAKAATTVPQHQGDIPRGTLRAIERDLEPAFGRGVAEVSEGGYGVVVTREDGHWLADVPELAGAHTYARSLPALDQAVREVIVLAAGLPDEAMPGLVLDYRYDTGDPDLDATALEVRRLRRQADELAAAVTARTAQVAAQLVARGLSVRDVAALLGISPQRVSQLTAKAS
jgi:predicted RNA binding protein YcfA (HicA-like mRNA interferase family)